ncbi:MAG: tetratricopeptide repeat protein [Chromatiales bacterium]|nr:tetratricopeptide repeat protein [Chromatiales bacterium]
MDRQALEDMLAQGQDNLMLRYTLGTLYFKEKEYETAAEHLERALEINNHHSASWKAYGRALAAQGRRSDAIDAYTTGITVAQKRGDIQAAKEMQIFLKRLQEH